MRISKRKINSTIEKEIYEIFYQLIADLNTPQEAKCFLEEILTDTEFEAIAKRLAVAVYLEKGRSYENIKSALKVSSATVATVAEQMKKGRGFALALNKIKAEQWADKWAEKFTHLMKFTRRR